MGANLSPPPEVLVLALVVSARLLHGAEAAGSSAVFDIGADLDLFLFSMMMSLVLLGVAIFDFLLEKFEDYLHHNKGRFHRRLLHKVLKQWMVRGLISFVLFIIKDQQLHVTSNDATGVTIEFVNLFLFVVGISLAAAAVLLTMATAPVKDRWDTYANLSLENLVALHGEVVSKPWTWYAAWPPRYFLGLRQAQVIEYHLFRSVFLRLNRSLLTPAFDFSKYSAAIVDEFIIDFFDVGWGSWLLALLVLFVTLPITEIDENGSAEVTAQGAIVFGFAILVMECLVCTYLQLAHQNVVARMGVVGGFKGVIKVLKELWVVPKHHFGRETAVIDVKDLLAATPSKAPTFKELTSSIANLGSGSSRAAVNFKNGRGSSSTLRSSWASGSGNNSISDTLSSSAPTGKIFAFANATPTAATTPARLSAQGSLKATPKCLQNGPGCNGCPSCGDPLWLPPEMVKECGMKGDPFVLATYRPFKGGSFQVGSRQLFKALFGMCTLQKCYYCAFYFSYAIGRATQSKVASAIAWAALMPIPLLLSLIPLSKRTLPIFAQLACLQGEIVWEVVSEIEEQQEMAVRAREKVLLKIKDTLDLKVKIHTAAQKGTTLKDHPGDSRRAIGKLPPPVARNGPAKRRSVNPRTLAMEELFAEWDRDGNGEITQAEMSTGLQNLGIFVSSAELRELFRLADPDHSKTIDLNEFRLFISDLQGSEAEPERFMRELEIRMVRSSFHVEQQRSTRMQKDDLLGFKSGSSVFGSSAGPVVGGILEGHYDEESEHNSYRKNPIYAGKRSSAARATTTAVIDEEKGEDIDPTSQWNKKKSDRHGHDHGGDRGLGGDGDGDENNEGGRRDAHHSCQPSLTILSDAELANAARSSWNRCEGEDLFFTSAPPSHPPHHHRHPSHGQNRPDPGVADKAGLPLPTPSTEEDQKEGAAHEREESPPGGVFVSPVPSFAESAALVPTQARARASARASASARARASDVHGPDDAAGGYVLMEKAGEIYI